MSDDRTEARLLLAVLRERWDEVDEIGRRDGPDPARFLYTAQGCDVLPQVHAALDGVGRLSFLGEGPAGRLSEARKKCRMDNLLLLARVERALDVLLAADVVPVLLKGAAVLHQFSIGFDSRTLDDVDLLVSHADFERSVEALRAAGWTDSAELEPARWLGESFEKTLLSPGPVPVMFDLHTHIAQRPRYRAEIGAILARAVPLSVAGREALRLESHDQAAHLLLHHIQHYFDRRLKWALDFARIVGETDFRWDGLGDRLREWGGTSAGSMSLRHIQKLLPEAVPAEGLRAVPTALWRRMLAVPLRSSHPLDLFRGTRRRPAQLYLGAILVESPTELPVALVRRVFSR